MTSRSLPTPTVQIDRHAARRRALASRSALLGAALALGAEAGRQLRAASRAETELNYYKTLASDNRRALAFIVAHGLYAPFTAWQDGAPPGPLAPGEKDPKNPQKSEVIEPPATLTPAARAASIAGQEIHGPPPGFQQAAETAPVPAAPVDAAPPAAAAVAPVPVAYPRLPAGLSPAEREAIYNERKKAKRAAAAAAREAAKGPAAAPALAPTGERLTKKGLPAKKPGRKPGTPWKKSDPTAKPAPPGPKAPESLPLPLDAAAAPPTVAEGEAPPAAAPASQPEGDVK